MAMTGDNPVVTVHKIMAIILLSLSLCYCLDERKGPSGYIWIYSSGHNSLHIFWDITEYLGMLQ